MSAVDFFIYLTNLYLLSNTGQGSFKGVGGTPVNKINIILTHKELTFDRSLEVSDRMTMLP